MLSAHDQKPAFPLDFLSLRTTAYVRFMEAGNLRKSNNTEEMGGSGHSDNHRIGCLRAVPGTAAAGRDPAGRLAVPAAAHRRRTGADRHLRLAGTHRRDLDLRPAPLPRAARAGR